MRNLKAFLFLVYLAYCTGVVSAYFEQPHESREQAGVRVLNALYSVIKGSI